MDIGSISLILLAAILFLLTLGVPLGFATGLLGMGLAVYQFGDPGLSIALQRVYGLTTSYVFLSVPLFIFMATMLERGGIAKEMYDSMKVWVGGVRGGVAITTIVMAVLLAAMSGIIGGEIVLLGLVALPQMLRLGYNQNLAIGAICASGSLGAMIPPSIVLIIYGLVSETSIHALFSAAIVPGLMLGASYVAYVVIRCAINPSLAPDVDKGDPIPLMSKLKQSKGLVAPLLVVFVVLGSIYGGITSITEAAAMGALGIIVITAIRGELSVKMVKASLDQTFRSMGAILWVTFGATIFTGAYTLSGGPDYVASGILGFDLPPLGVIGLIVLVFLLLGMFMDWIGIVLLCMPVFVPIILQLGYDPVWFGVLFCMTMQIAFLSPPFGPAAFYLKSVTPPEITLMDIYKSFLPFVAIQVAILLVVLLFPEIVTVFL